MVVVAAQHGVRKSACNGVPPGLEDAFGGSAVWALQLWRVPTVLGVAAWSFSLQQEHTSPWGL